MATQTFHNIARRVVLYSWWTTIFTAATYFHLWPTLLIGYLIPVFIGYPLSVLCQMSEHRWGWTGSTEDKTFPRLFNIEPPKSINPLIWIAYVWKLLFILYWQLAVLFTLNEHQQHHAKGKEITWYKAAYTPDAQSDLPKAIYGIRGHLQEAFQSLADAPPLEAE
ncbi:MAG: hypothetical protein WCD18_07405 [Thermosynechococcaceae cyanobacterium]